MEPREGLRKVFERPRLLLSNEHSLCPGCGEPLALRTILEVIDELGRAADTISVCGIGCYTAFPNLIDVDVIQALHGRAPSVATGARRCLPGNLIWTLQGDGDMVSEGLQEVIHAAARGERITCILLNNGVFGETGGHMTATSVAGQKTKTTPKGRDAARHGNPIRLAELVAAVDGASYVARGAMSTPAAIAWTKRIVREAFEDQIAGNGFSLVEILTMCPTDWYVEPQEGPRWLEKNLERHYPLQILKCTAPNQPLMDANELGLRRMRVLPEPDETTRFWWEAAARGELWVLRCRGCRRFVHPPRTPCPKCGSDELEPEKVSGRGTVHTWTIAHREVPGHEVPFALVMVELEEQPGLRVLANLRDCPLDEVRVGLPVEVVFEDAGGGVTLPQFRPL